MINEIPKLGGVHTLGKLIEGLAARHLQAWDVKW
jgi:hypothetical protein